MRLVAAVEPDQQTGRKARKKLVIQRRDASRFRIGTLVLVGGIEMIVMSYRGESRRSITN